MGEAFLNRYVPIIIMKYRLIALLVAFGFVLVHAGVSQADVDLQVNYTRWTFTAAGDSLVTEGGNITNLTISSTTLTDRWAGVFGNFSGTIVLKEAGDGAGVQLFSWTWSGSGWVCFTQDTAFNFGTSQAATASDVDTAFAFPTTASDSATNTLTGTGTVDLSVATVTGAATATHQSGSAYATYAIKDAATPTEADLAFCSKLRQGNGYKGVPVDFEVMLPTTFGPSGFETYYIFVDLS